MRTSKVYKLKISACILITEEDGSIKEIVTKPIDIYRGTEFTFNEIESIERIALQETQIGRSGEN